jgi:hypothetical protein
MLIIALLKEYLTIKSQNLTIYTKFNSLIVVLNYFLNIYPHYVYTTLSQIFQVSELNSYDQTIYSNLSLKAYIHENFDIFKQFSINIDLLKQYLVLFLVKLINSSANLLYLLSKNFEEIGKIPQSMISLILNCKLFFLQVNIKNLNDIQLKLKESQINKTELKNDITSVLKQLTHEPYEIFKYLLHMSTIPNGINEFEELRLLIQDFLVILNVYHAF